MAIAAAKHYIPAATARYKRAHGTTQAPNTFMNYSDRSTKDFSCTSFLAFIGKLVVENGSVCSWDFTAPYEGKWLHDREGGVVKGAGNKGMTTPGAINWDLNKTWSSTLISYYQKHFNQPRFKKIKRYFYEIEPQKISNIPSPHKTLPGIMSYYHFLCVKDAYKIYYRDYPCDCDECMNNKWNECKQKYICGDYRVHQLDDSIAFPPELTIEEYNRLNKRTKSAYKPVHSHNTQPLRDNPY